MQKTPLEEKCQRKLFEKSFLWHPSKTFEKGKNTAGQCAEIFPVCTDPVQRFRGVKESLLQRLSLEKEVSENEIFTRH